MILFHRVEVGEGTPLGCAQCAMPQTPAYHDPDSVESRLQSIADEPGRPPGPNVVLCGPEPFAHPRLPVLVASAVRSGFERIAIETDGAALSVRENAEGVLHAGVRHLFVRVVATDERAGARVVPRPTAIPAAREGVGAFLDAARTAGATVVVTAVVPVCAHNLASLSAMVADLAAWGVHAVTLYQAGELPSSAGTVIAAACDTGMVNRLWVEVRRPLPLPSTHALHVAPEGETCD